jgi:hypothetical protein
MKKNYRHFIIVKRKLVAISVIRTIKLIWKKIGKATKKQTQVKRKTQIKNPYKNHRINTKKGLNLKSEFGESMSEINSTDMNYKYDH